MKKFAPISAAILAGSMMLLGTSTVSAATQEHINPWQQCGIGAGLFDENGTAAAISNIIWDSGTTAVTSATMSPETCSSKEIEVARFVDETYDQLVMETAMGEGEHLTAALGLMNCSSAAQEEVIGHLRTDLQEASSATDFAELPHSDKAFQYYQSLNQASSTCAAS